MISPKPAQTPHAVLDPQQLPGWDPQWSRLVEANTCDGAREFHVLDTGPALTDLGFGANDVDAIVIAVHGNPTWSYLWRHIAQASIDAAQGKVDLGPSAGKAPIIRVIAPDQLDMGFSERLGHPGFPSTTANTTSYRTLEQRISDLDAIIKELVDASSNIPVFSLGHDWGGIISLGWATNAAVRSAGSQIEPTGMISLNTAVWHDESDPIPAPLRAALAGPVLAGSTVVTPAFLDTTLALGQPALSGSVKAAYKAPYASRAERGGIGGFVADIPATDSHRSRAALRTVADQLALTDKAALLLWGAKDPVFIDRYQHDLLQRIDNVEIHRYNTAGHLLAEDRDISIPLLGWIRQQLDRDTRPTPDPAAGRGSEAVGEYSPLWSYLDQWSGSTTKAMVDMTIKDANSRPFEVTWAKLSSMVDAMAVGLREAGMRPGDRVSMLVEPGRDLTAALYAVLRVGGVAVVTDAGLGVDGMTRAIKSAAPQWIIGQTPGLSLARIKNLPGKRLSVKTMDPLARSILGLSGSMYGFASTYAGQKYRPTAQHPDPDPADDAAILFTSGSTGPAKGVRYTHRKLSALTQRLQHTLNVAPGSSLLAGFAPFALLGPAIGATSVTPNMSVTKPATLTATALADAAIAGDATMIFASPAALSNVVDTAHELNAQQREALKHISMLLSAGAPVPVPLMDEVLELIPNAEFHSPYGMTESLLVSDIDHHTQHAIADRTDRGVCVGKPLDVVRVAMAPLDFLGRSSDQLVEGDEAINQLSEIVISTPHMLAGYDKLYNTNRQTRVDSVDGLQWHRTGDIGHFDEDGRLWIEGRTQHIVTPATGAIGPGGPEDDIQRLSEINRAAIVGVGPAGTQAIVAVIEPHDQSIKPGLAPTALTDDVRAATDVDLAAVLVTHKVPVDIRHNSKINRPLLAQWATDVLAGGKVGTL
ncbi:alpha/beta fold hydrolase [Yaniella halotolerans]|uniref:alpha/beta fold hydrolase n=1 Tax=Yaniella halotolerans TaxID=225453 RepID=UPI0003F8745D|nr:alpha/beta fold hydrolase [Yaniella halotolerans]